MKSALTLSPSNQLSQDSPAGVMIRVSEGDLVRFTRQDREQGRDTQTLWEVSRIADNGDITLKSGESTRLIQPGRDMTDAHIDYAYAGTAHRAQGASETFVIALAGATGARQRLASLSDVYVALSRMKQHVQVYTDDSGRWLSAVAGSERRQTAHDVLDAEQDSGLPSAPVRKHQKYLPPQAAGPNRSHFSYNTQVQPPKKPARPCKSETTELHPTTEKRRRPGRRPGTTSLLMMDVVTRILSRCKWCRWSF